MTNEIARIKEMFVSTQGEGPLVGYRQLFIRFCACNLACKFCDTDYSFENSNFVYSPKELAELIQKEFEIDDPEIISAVRNHTIGKVNMSVFDKIIFLADKIEPNTRDKSYIKRI